MHEAIDSIYTAESLFASFFEGKLKKAGVRLSDAERGRVREAVNEYVRTNDLSVLASAIERKGHINIEITDADLERFTERVTKAQEKHIEIAIQKFARMRAQAAVEWAGAARNNEEGTTVVRVHLNETGAVTGALVARPSGYDELDVAAIGCIAKLRFQPASQNGKPLASVSRYGWRWAINWGPLNLNKCDELKAAAEARSQFPSSTRPAKPTAMVCKCWEESGRFLGARVVESTGVARLDEGAIKLDQSIGGQSLPPGHPGCMAYKMQFDLKN